LLVKDDIARDIHAARLNVKALVAFVVAAISNKHAFFGAEGEFMRVVRTKERPASATENFKKIIVRFGFVS
jgi:predicted Ser/Thr protein kinase